MGLQALSPELNSYPERHMWAMLDSLAPGQPRVILRWRGYLLGALVLHVC